MDHRRASDMPAGRQTGGQKRRIGLLFVPIPVQLALAFVSIELG